MQSKINDIYTFSPHRQYVVKLHSDYRCHANSFSQLGEIGAFDPLPYPVIDSYPQSKAVRVGDLVEFECSASDAADHLPNWPKHDLTVDIVYENDILRDLSSGKFRNRVEKLDKQ